MRSRYRSGRRGDGPGLDPATTVEGDRGVNARSADGVLGDPGAASIRNVDEHSRGIDGDGADSSRRYGSGGQGRERPVALSRIATRRCCSIRNVSLSARGSTATDWCPDPAAAWTWGVSARFAPIAYCDTLLLPLFATVDVSGGGVHRKDWGPDPAATAAVMGAIEPSAAIDVLRKGPAAVSRRRRTGPRDDGDDWGAVPMRPRRWTSGVSDPPVAIVYCETLSLPELRRVGGICPKGRRPRTGLAPPRRAAAGMSEPLAPIVIARFCRRPVSSHRRLPEGSTARDRGPIPSRRRQWTWAQANRRTRGVLRTLSSLRSLRRRKAERAVAATVVIATTGGHSGWGRRMGCWPSANRLPRSHISRRAAARFANTRGDRTHPTENGLRLDPAAMLAMA